MKLIYLSEANLRDRLLIRDLVFNFKSPEKALVIHESFDGSIRDTRFVTKRLSSLFSEAMVYNNAFSADQRDLVKRDEAGQLIIKTSTLLSLIDPIQMIILGPVIKENGDAGLIEGEELLRATRQQMDFSELLLFPDNVLSPLAGKAALMDGEDIYQELLAVYEEERESLDRAMRFRPSRIVSPKYFNSDS